MNHLDAKLRHAYAICGWRVESDIPLFGACEWDAEDKLPDVVIRVGNVEKQLDGSLQLGPLIQADRDGNCLLTVEGVARYLIRKGREVVVDPASAPDSPEVNALLFGAVLGTLAYQRGFLPLHANVVRIGTRVVALSGDSGAGKSTLAAALIRRGHDFLADDVCVLDYRQDLPIVQPSSPIVKLWRDSYETLGLSATAFVQDVGGQPRYRLALPERFQAMPMPLSEFIWIQEANDQIRTGLRLQRGLSALRYLKRGAYSRRIGELLLGEAGLQQAWLRIAGKLSTYTLGRRRILGGVDALAVMVEQGQIAD